MYKLLTTASYFEHDILDGPFLTFFASKAANYSQFKGKCLFFTEAAFVHLQFPHFYTFPASARFRSSKF